jgi:hypothetical protein
VAGEQSASGPHECSAGGLGTACLGSSLDFHTTCL